jgi:hypothetical protein
MALLLLLLGAGLWITVGAQGVTTAEGLGK